MSDAAPPEEAASNAETVQQLAIAAPVEQGAAEPPENVDWKAIPVAEQMKKGWYRATPRKSRNPGGK